VAIKARATADSTWFTMLRSMRMARLCCRPLNSRVQIFDANGKYLGKWTTSDSPGAVYFSAENAIYMWDGINNRIVKLNLDGEIQGVSALTAHPGKLDFAHNIAVDSAGAST